MPMFGTRPVTQGTPPMPQPGPAPGPARTTAARAAPAAGRSVPAPRVRDKVVFANPLLTAEGRARALQTFKLFLFYFFMIWVIPVLFATIYGSAPQMVMLFVFCMFLFALTPLSQVDGNVLACALVASVILGSVAGLHCYYAHVQVMHSLMDGNSYDGVFAQQSSRAFSDAAYLKFAGDATVDSELSIGFTTLEGGATTYCVAPVSDSQFSGRVEFWAVGTDCCGHRGTFDCDAAGTAGMNHAIVLRDPEHSDPLYPIFGKHLAPSRNRRDLFLKAIEQAEKAHGITTQDPLLVHWIDGTKEDYIDKEWAAVLMSLLTAAFLAVANAIFLTHLTLSFEDEQNLEEKLEAQLAVAHHFAADIPLNVQIFVEEHQPAVPKNPKFFRDLCVSRALTPYFVLMTCVVLWSWLYTFAVGHVLMVLFMLILGVEIIGLLMNSDRYVYGVFMIFITAVGIAIGRYNYVENTFRYYAVENHRSYSDVPPDQDAAQYRDAGIILFEQGTVVAIQDSVGFLTGSVTYCAAPIVRGDAGGSLRMDFWAVGVNCCGDRGEFDCDGARDPAAHGGVVIHDFTEPDSVAQITDTVHKNYLRAIQAATDMHHLPHSEDPILVRWGSDPRELQWQWMNKATGVVVLTAIVSLMALSSTALISFCWGKITYRRRMESFQKDLHREQNNSARAGGGPPSGRGP